MNEQTEKLLTTLAQKLGVTIEHLWGVLCKQALISGTVDLITMTVWLGFMAWSFCLVKRNTTVPAPTKGDPYPRSVWTDEFGFFAWLLWCVLAIVAMVIITCGLDTTAAAFLNPEYWAFKQIFKS